MSKQTELAWAAGFFDGEGSVSCAVNNGKPHSIIYLRVGQADDDGRIAEVLIRFEAAVGVGKIYHHNWATDTHRETHQWVAGKQADVRHCIALLTPYLSSRKLEQIERVLYLYEEATGREYGS